MSKSSNSHPDSGVQSAILGDPLEPHHSVKDIAQFWQVDAETVSKIFRNEPGVLVHGNNGRKDGKRNYTIIRIPDSVLSRVYKRLTQGQSRDFSGLSRKIRTRAAKPDESHSKPKPF